MTFKEWNAVMMIAGQVVVTVWLLQGGLQLPGVSETLAGTAIRLLWAIAFMIVWNIVAAIVTAILVAIVTQQPEVDEPSDERDRLVDARSSRNAYFGTAGAGACVLIVFALGFDPVVALYALFGALMLGGFVDSASRLVYYRIG